MNVKPFYQEMHRFFKGQVALGENATISAAAINRWQTCGKTGVWGLSQEYMIDPAGASIRVTEEHVKAVAKTEAIVFH